jgi:(S)-2-hydroxyglutarate dehydrogenase
MYDITIVGGGIIGLATGYTLLKERPSLKILLLEKESKIAQHQTGHNSGVIHSGIYYKPGSSKAINCRRGINLLLQFCNNYNIPYDMCGKIIVASDKQSLKNLSMLHERGKGNGIKGIKRLSRDELLDYEPYATGIAALYCPGTGIVDYKKVCEKLSECIKEKAEIVNNEKVVSLEKRLNGITVITENFEYKTHFLINCAGLFSDQVSKLSGIQLQTRIVPFRGEYFTLKNKAKYLVKNLIYPVPDPQYPFLGVHFTRTINGEVEAGPNAVLAWAREGYKKTDVNISEMWDYLSYSGFWKMARKYWSTGISEYYRSFFKSAFVSELQKMVPEIKSSDISHSPAGVRAQALSLNGDLVDDFVLNTIDGMIHVINAPSPAATSSLAIGESIAKIYFGK